MSWLDAAELSDGPPVLAFAWGEALVVVVKKSMKLMLLRGTGCPVSSCNCGNDKGMFGPGGLPSCLDSIISYSNAVEWVFSSLSYFLSWYVMAYGNMVNTFYQQVSNYIHKYLNTENAFR